MRHVVSIGGGLTSTIELPLAVIQKYGADNVDFVMCALKGEHPDTWRMVNWLEEKTGKRVTLISWQPTPNIRTIKALGKAVKYRINAPQSQWRDIWDAFEARRFLGNSRIDPCSDLLKRQLIRHYIKDHYPNGCYLHVGITYDERHRLKRITQNWAESGVVIKGDLVQLLRHDPTPKTERAMNLMGWIPALYAIGFDHNNCGGFCVKAGKAHMGRLLWYYPELYKHHEEREQEWRSRFGDVTILREVVNGVKQNITLKELRERYEIEWGRTMFDPYEPFPDEDEYQIMGSGACTMCDAIA